MTDRVSPDRRVLILHQDKPDPLALEATHHAYPAYENAAEALHHFEFLWTRDARLHAI